MQEGRVISLLEFKRGEDTLCNSLALVRPKYCPSIVPELVPLGFPSLAQTAVLAAQLPRMGQLRSLWRREGGWSAETTSVLVPVGGHSLVVSELRMPHALCWPPGWLRADLTFTSPETLRV